MNLFTGNSSYYHLLKYILFLLKHPVYQVIDSCMFHSTKQRYDTFHMRYIHATHFNAIVPCAGFWAELLTMQCTSNENCALLGYYAASSGNLLPTFRDNLSTWSLWSMTPRAVVISYRRFGTTCWPHLYGSRTPRVVVISYWRFGKRIALSSWVKDPWRLDR
jgi:hypothetical protein